MDPTADNYGAFLAGIDDLVRDSELRDLQTTQRAGQRRHSLVETGTRFYRLLQESVRIGNARSYVDELLATQELKVEGKAEVLLLA